MHGHAQTQVALRNLLLVSVYPRPAQFTAGDSIRGMAKVSVTGSPDRVSALSGPGTRPVSGQLSGTASGGASHHVPVSCCLPATGIRFSVTLFPPGSWAFLTVGLPGTTLRPDPDGVSTFHTCEIRPGWVPSTPGTAVFSPGRMPCPAGACRFPAASPCTPQPHPTSGATHHEASTRVHAIHPSGLPLACGLPDGTGSPRAFPCAPHPAVTGSARQGGAGP